MGLESKAKTIPHLQKLIIWEKLHGSEEKAQQLEQTSYLTLEEAQKAETKAHDKAVAHWERVYDKQSKKLKQTKEDFEKANKCAKIFVEKAEKLEGQFVKAIKILDDEGAVDNSLVDSLREVLTQK